MQPDTKNSCPLGRQPLCGKRRDHACQYVTASACCHTAVSGKVQISTLEKETRSCDGIEEYVKNLLEEIQENIYQKALKYRNEHIVKVNTYDEFKEQIEKGGFILAHWDGTTETEERIKEETKATIRCLPFEADEESLTPGVDMVTGKPSARRVLFARAY